MTRNRRETATTPKPRPAGNTTSDQAKPYIERIENLLAEKQKLSTEIGEEIKIVYEQAEREAQIEPKALKHVVKLRKQTRDNAAAREKMDDDARAQCDVLANAFVDADPEFASLLRMMADNGASVSVHLAPDPVSHEQTDDIDRAFG